MKPRFLGNDGGYDVVVDGRTIGRVRRTTEHYNLWPRPATYTLWRAILPDGTWLPEKESTRRDAAARLVAIAELD